MLPWGIKPVSNRNSVLLFEIHAATNCRTNGNSTLTRLWNTILSHQILPAAGATKRQGGSNCSTKGSSQQSLPKLSGTLHFFRNRGETKDHFCKLKADSCSFHINVHGAPAVLQQSGVFCPILHALLLFWLFQDVQKFPSSHFSSWKKKKKGKLT